MQDIRLVDSDGEYLNLETQGGEKFRLVLDDSLRSAVKRESPVHLDTVSISPREIQDLVRSGITAEEVASKHSVPLDYVEKFALTVVDEIGHIIASAQTVRISVEADRYSEATQMEFGEILDARLRKAGATNAVWSATKLEGEPWMVSVTYLVADESRAAVWSFDQRKLVLSPENEAAAKLSAGDFAASTSAPKLRQVDVPTENTRIIELPRVEEVENFDEDARTISPSPVSSIEELTRSSLQAVSDEDTGSEISAAETLSPTADLLEALRKKRSMASQSSNSNSNHAPDVASPELPETFATPQAVEELVAREVEQASETETEQTPAPVSPGAKKGRPSMPSWDEIVFGTKADD